MNPPSILSFPHVGVAGHRMRHRTPSHAAEGVELGPIPQKEVRLWDRARETADLI